MEVLCVGDLFLSSERFRKAIEEELGEDFGPVREISWGGEGAGSAEDQHHLQQVTDQDGPEAVLKPGCIVEAGRDAEAGALGAAVCAGIGTGVYSSLDDATRRVVRLSRAHDPAPEGRDRLAEAYETYTALAEALEPVWSRLG